MAGKQTTSNPLITDKPSDAPLSVQLHPLVLLTISDYLTRHTLRSQSGPVIGAIIGLQNGRNFTLEHAFECKVTQQDGNVLVDPSWFGERLEQYRDVHKAPPLDLVAMFVLGTAEGPKHVHVPVLRQVQQMTGNDGVMLVVFHGEMVDELQGGKLPISLYESVKEQDDSLKFRELSFDVETGEAEMIGVDTVAQSSAAAAAVQPVTDAPAESSKKEKGKGKGKAKEKDDEASNGEEPGILSPEDDEVIASLQAKASAIKMLNQRINLIRSYLETLPASYLTDASSSEPPPENTNHTLLRHINSLLSRIPLLSPPTSSTEAAAPVASKQQTDVHLTALLAALSRATSEASTMGSKFHAFSREKENRMRNGGFGRSMPIGMGGIGGGRGGFGGDEGIIGDAGGA